MSNTTQQTAVFIPLTALWAFVESGLGGMMHALHLPFTGVVLGGFSVLIVCLLAHYETPLWGQIVKATLIVLAVKAAVNPATPPTAYIAVAFQGLCGAALFAINKHSMWVCWMYGILAMLESAFQKLLVLTLIFGTEWWTAVDAYFVSVTKPFGMMPEMAGSQFVIAGYLGVFGIWGVVLGIWMYHLPSQLATRLQWYTHLQPSSEAIQTTQKKSFTWRKVLFLMGPILLLLSFFLAPMSQSKMHAGVWLLRTFAIVLVGLYIVLPIWQYCMQKWVKRQQRSFQEIGEVMDFIPKIALYVQPLYKEVAQKYKGIAKIKEFVLGLIVITLRVSNAQ